MHAHAYRTFCQKVDVGFATSVICHPLFFSLYAFLPLLLPTDNFQFNSRRPLHRGARCGEFSCEGCGAPKRKTVSINLFAKKEDSDGADNLNNATDTVFSSLHVYLLLVLLYEIFFFLFCLPFAYKLHQVSSILCPS